MGFLKYSNGWGHLIMSLACLGVGVYLLILGYATIGISLIATVSAAWFVPGAAKQVANGVSDAINPPPPEPTPLKSKTTSAFVPPLPQQPPASA